MQGANGKENFTIFTLYEEQYERVLEKQGEHTPPVENFNPIDHVLNYEPFLTWDAFYRNMCFYLADNNIETCRKVYEDWGISDTYNWYYWKKTFTFDPNT